MPSINDNLTASNNYLVNTESDVSEITDQLSDAPNANVAPVQRNFIVNAHTAYHQPPITAGDGNGLLLDRASANNPSLENEMPLSFASFYYSLKVIKGKG